MKEIQTSEERLSPEFKSSRINPSPEVVMNKLSPLHELKISPMSQGAISSNCTSIFLSMSRSLTSKPTSIPSTKLLRSAFPRVFLFIFTFLRGGSSSTSNYYQKRLGGEKIRYEIHLRFPPVQSSKQLHEPLQDKQLEYSIVRPIQEQQLNMVVP